MESQWHNIPGHTRHVGWDTPVPRSPYPIPYGPIRLQSTYYLPIASPPNSSGSIDYTESTSKGSTSIEASMKRCVLLIVGEWPTDRIAAPSQSFALTYDLDVSPVRCLRTIVANRVVSPRSKVEQDMYSIYFD